MLPVTHGRDSGGQEEKVSAVPMSGWESSPYVGDEDDGTKAGALEVEGPGEVRRVR
jgi:hypothetical protein